MGRPKEHDEQTAAALLDAAERIAEQDGLAALSVRRVANEVGTTTRAVYSLFGAKEGLVAALGARAFDLLGATVAALPTTGDPAADLVRAGLVFRRFTREHPALFRIGVQHIDVPPESGRDVRRRRVSGARRAPRPGGPPGRRRPVRPASLRGRRLGIPRAVRRVGDRRGALPRPRLGRRPPVARCPVGARPRVGGDGAWLSLLPSDVGLR